MKKLLIAGIPILCLLSLFLYARFLANNPSSSFVPLAPNQSVYVRDSSQEVWLSKADAAEVISLFNSYSRYQNGTSDCSSALQLVIGEEVIQLHDDHCNLLTQDLSLTFSSEDIQKLSDILSVYSVEFTN